MKKNDNWNNNGTKFFYYSPMETTNRSSRTAFGSVVQNLL